MSWTYILLCSDSALYVGSTRNLDNRMYQHAMGEADAFTRTRKPLTLVSAAEFDSIGEAYACERRVKGWRREKKFALIESRFDDLPALARKKWGTPEDVRAAVDLVSTTSEELAPDER